MTCQQQPHIRLQKPYNQPLASAVESHTQASFPGTCLTSQLSPTTCTILLSHGPMFVFSTTSLYVGVPFTADNTPYTARSARLGLSPPRNLLLPTASMNSLVSCKRNKQNQQRHVGSLSLWPQLAGPLHMWSVLLCPLLQHYSCCSWTKYNLCRGNHGLIQRDELPNHVYRSA